MNRIIRLALVLPLVAAGAVFAAKHPRADEAPRLLPAPALDLPKATPSSSLQTITVSGGCFWGVQGVFEHVAGVTSAVAGYAGGNADTAHYETVSSGTTGHAESVKITYDPAQTSLGRILRIFFSVALDPTRTDGQGPDSGSQYRSEIWVSNPDQARIATSYIAQLDQTHAFGAPIATRVDPLPGFYPAERYHQDYLTLNPDQPYIAINDLPKVDALHQFFPADWRPQPKTVLGGQPPV